MDPNNTIKGSDFIKTIEQSSLEELTEVVGQAKAQIVHNYFKEQKSV